MKFQYIALSAASLFSSVKAEEEANRPVNVCLLSLLGINLNCNLYQQDNRIVDYNTAENYYSSHGAQIPISYNVYNNYYNSIPANTYDIYELRTVYPYYILV